MWQEGATRLLDYGGNKTAVPALFVPSLINKSYILDLDAERSLMRWLAQQGIRTLLLDWGTPDTHESAYGLEDYALRLERAIQEIGRPINLVGYCMGGNLALATALRQPDLVRSLALLATPWDFHAGGQAEALRCSTLFRAWQPLCTPLGQLPIDLIQTLFTMLDPFAPQRKFLRFAEMEDAHDVDSFVALEDWLNDGIPMPMKAAEDCLLGWYEQNATAESEWAVDGDVVDPSALTCPALVMIPEEDRIVPPASAASLAAALPNRTRLNVPLGHVGMIVSRDAPSRVWQPLARWLHT